MSKTEFVAEVKKQLHLRHESYEDLASATGYTHRSMQQMLSENGLISKPAKKKICDYLGIKEQID